MTTAGGTSDQSTNEIGNALALWVDVTGVDPSARSMRLGDWELYRANETLQKAQVLDPGELTTNLLLDTFATRYFSERTFSVAKLLNGFDDVDAYLGKARQLLGLLRGDDALNAREAFRAEVRAGVAHYAAGRDDVQAVLDSNEALGAIRFSALHSAATLHAHQFLDGEPDPAPPVLLDRVAVFWNINSLLTAALSWPSGVSLNLVRDPDNRFSYFAFAIRNGGRLFVLTDKQQVDHPLQKYMTRARAQERRWVERLNANLFPYELVGAKEITDDQGDVVGLDFRNEGLVPFGQSHQLTLPIAGMKPDELVWTTMLLALIVKRFWRRGETLPELSYTGEAIRDPQKLIEQAARAGLPALVDARPAIEVGDLAIDDVRFDALPDNLRQHATRHAAWMEERYGPTVPPAVLNVTGTGGVAFLRHDSGEVVQDLPEIENFRGDIVIGRSKPSALRLQTFDLTEFGTETEILQDRQFIARYNFVGSVVEQAEAEWAREAPAIEAWFQRAVKRAAPRLLDAVAAGRLDVSNFALSYGSFDRKPTQHTSAQILTFYRYFKARGHSVSNGSYYAGFGRNPGVGVLAGGRFGPGGRYPCFVRGTDAVWACRFKPNTPQSLAEVLGVPLDELPEMLRFWQPVTPYTGNQILNRIDPMEWRTDRFWDGKFQGTIVLYLSQAEMRARNPSVSAIEATSDNQPLCAPGVGGKAAHSTVVSW